MKQSDISKSLMVDALFILMEKKDVQSITVKDIAEKAGVNRLTFYRNFEVKEDILIWHIEQGFQSYLENIDKETDMDLQLAITKCFQFWGSREKEIRLLTKQKLTYLIRTPFDECMNVVLERLHIRMNCSQIQKTFILGGLFSSMVLWIEDEMKESPQKICQEIFAMFSKEFLYEQNGLNL